MDCNNLGIDVKVKQTRWIGGEFSNEIKKGGFRKYFLFNVHAFFFLRV